MFSSIVKALFGQPEVPVELANRPVHQAPDFAIEEPEAIKRQFESWRDGAGLDSQAAEASLYLAVEGELAF